MQIFDLTQLRSASNPPVSFQETAHFEINFQGSRLSEETEIDFSRFYAESAEFGEETPLRTASDEGYAHNIAINEESGYAYLVGSNNCNGGLYMLDLSNPLSPSAKGCFSEWGWISDAQCVTYDGPDSTYSNREICFISYDYGLGVIDVTNKSDPEWLSYLEESNFNSIDQGWLTEDMKYFLVGDRNNGGKLRTYVVDVSNLDNISVEYTYLTPIVARHGNNFVKGNYLYQASHRAGLRILDLSDVSEGEVEEVGYFDTTPNKSGSGNDGVWGVYPYFSSGVVVISSVDEGVFIVRSPDVMNDSSPSLNPSTMPSFIPTPTMAVSNTCTSSIAGTYPCEDTDLIGLISSATFTESSVRQISE